MIEGRLDVGGAVVFWTFADGTDRFKLWDGFQPLGLESFVPEPRPASAVLKDSLQETLGGPRVLVRPLATRDGFAVVQEDRGTIDNTYVTSLVARVGGDPAELAFEPLDERASRIIEQFRLQSQRISGSQLSAALVKVVENLGGTRLRPTGAIYWIPGHKLEEWSAVARAVEAASTGKPSAVYVIQHKLDTDAVRAVRDAIIVEVQTEAKRIVEDVNTGDLGGRALETRRNQAASLREKVLLYEDLLSVGLTSLHDVVDAADQATAVATLLLTADPDSLVSEHIGFGAK